MALSNLLPKQKLKKLDVTSRYAYFVGLSSLAVSLVVAVFTFFKLWLAAQTNFFASLLVSFIVYYIFAEIYTYILLLGLRMAEKSEDKL